MVGVCQDNPRVDGEHAAVRTAREAAEEEQVFHGAEVPITHEC